MLKGKVALVTGSTSGIGLGIAKAFAAEGADLVLNGFGEARAIEQLRKEVAKRTGVKVSYRGADMMKPPEIVEMIETATREHGHVSVGCLDRHPGHAGRNLRAAGGGGRDRPVVDAPCRCPGQWPAGPAAAQRRHCHVALDLRRHHASELPPHRDGDSGRAAARGRRGDALGKAFGAF